MQLKLFVTTNFLKSRISEQSKDNLQTYTVTAYAIPSMTKDFIDYESCVCLAGIRELFNYSHSKSEVGYVENNM